MAGLGHGLQLTRRIIECAKNRGLGEIYGDVLRDNTTMLKMCDFIGFERSAIPDDPSIVRVTLRQRLLMSPNGVTFCKSPV